MLFNSIDFAIFLPLVFAFYWFLSKYDIKYQNIFLVIASYIFYGWWDFRFLSLLFFSSIVDFLIGLSLKNETNIKKRKFYLAISLTVNLGLLGFFKYFNFFIDNFVKAFTIFGFKIDARNEKKSSVGSNFFLYTSIE